MQMVEINIQFCTQFCLSLTFKRSAECQACAVPAGDAGGGRGESRAAIRIQIGCCVESTQGSRFLVSGRGFISEVEPAPESPGNSAQYPFTLKMCFTSLTFSVITLFLT